MVTRKNPVLILLLAVLLTGCEQPNDGVLRIALANAAENLDPRFATDAVSSRINRLLYRKLVELDEHSQPVPGLARWKKLTPVHYRFALGKKGRLFHDGTLLTALDVKATYDFVLDPKNGSPHRKVVEMIDRVVVIDKDTIDFYLNRPSALFPAFLMIGIVPRANIKEEIRTRYPVGSGPFRFVRWENGQKLVLERLQDGLRVRFERVRDSTVRVLKLVRGEVDLLQNDISPELVAWARKRPGLMVERRPGANFSYIGFNLQDNHVGRLPIRQAIALAIDRQAIIDQVMVGGAQLAGGLLPPTHWAGNPDLGGWPFQPERAREILATAGYSVQHPLHLTYKTSTDPFRVRIATIIQAQLKDVGIDVQVQSYDWGTFYGDIKAGKFQMYSLAWVGIHTPDIFRYVFHSGSVPPNGANRGRYSNPEVDQQIEKIEKQLRWQGMAAGYRNLQAILDKDLPYIPLWYEDHVVVHNARVLGYTISPDGNYDGLIKVQYGTGKNAKD